MGPEFPTHSDPFSETVNSESKGRIFYLAMREGRPFISSNPDVPQLYPGP